MEMDGQISREGIEKPIEDFITASSRQACVGWRRPTLLRRRTPKRGLAQEPRPAVIGQVTGAVQCADLPDRPTHWRE
jgi:hypothetical protein